MTIDRTFDLTDEQLFVAADEGWRSPGSHGLRAVAALARQGWAPVGTGPSLEDLGPLIAWLGEMAIQAADAGRSDEAGMLTWASLVLGERVNEDAPDHVASVSNMVKSAPDTVYSRALQPNTMQLMKTSDDILPGPLSEHELREQWNQQADEHNQWESLDSEEQFAWAQVRAIAMDREAAPPADGEVAELVEWLNSTGELAGSADIEESKRYWRAAELLQQRHPAPVAVSERLPDASDPGECRMPAGECWWFDPHADGAWYFDSYQGNYTHWLPPPALPLPAGEGK